MASTLYVFYSHYSVVPMTDYNQNLASLTMDRKEFLQSTNLNQRTSGPVKTHLTPGPGIYFNAFIHVYSPRAGADNSLGTNVDFNRKPLSLCPFVASLTKEI